MSIKCNICGRYIQNKRALEWHKALKHGIPKPDLSQTKGGQKPDFEAEKQQISNLKQLNQIKSQELEIEEVKEEHKYECGMCGALFDELDEDWFGNKRCPECNKLLEV